MVQFSTIIVSWNVKSELLDCLASLKQFQPDQSEIIVVDNDSSDGTVEAIQNKFPDVHVLANSENLGFAKANNQAMRIAKGTFFFLLNPDTRVTTGSIGKLMEVLDSNPGVAICAPKIIDENGKQHHSISPPPIFWSVFYKKTMIRALDPFRHRKKRFNMPDSPNSINLDVEQVSGAAMMIRRNAIEQVGLMDERFFLYFEDNDLCLMMKKAGWKLAYAPKAEIMHFGARSSIQVNSKKDIMMYRSMFQYFKKHRGLLATILFAMVLKPCVLIKYIWKIVTGSIELCFAIGISNIAKKEKSLAKIKSSASFLVNHSFEFLFRT